MRFVFKIGPIPVTDGQVHALFVHPPEQDAVTFFGDTEPAGLEQVVRRYDAADLECEPELARVAPEFGIRVGEITPERAHIIGLRAFDLALPHHFDGVEHEGIIYQFGVSGGKFWGVSPWQYKYAKQPVSIVLSGAVEIAFEGTVMGGDLEYGLFLYPQAGSVKRAIDLALAGDLEEAGRVDSLGTTFQEEPQFAPDAMRRAYGLARLPVPTKMLNRAGVPLGDLDLLSLAAALSAVSYMNDTNTIGTASVTVAGLTVQATARAAGAA